MLPSLISAAANLNDATSNLLNAGVSGYGESARAQSDANYLPTLVGNYISIFLLVVGALLLVLLIYGGYLWMNARGDAEQVKKAKNIIIDAVIGIIIIFAAYAISSFIISHLVPGGGSGGSGLITT